MIGPGAESSAGGPGARRVLITGVANFWGEHLARALIADPRVEHVVGIDTRPPSPSIRAQIDNVRADLRAADLRAIIGEGRIDTVVHNDIPGFADTDHTARQLHELTVIGTLALITALHDQPTLRTLVVRSSAAIYGAQAAGPAFFVEELAQRYPLHTRYQRDIGELETLVDGFARRAPAVTVTVLRLQPVVGTTLETPITRLLSSPVVPTVLGFDPQLQFVHEDDSAAVLHHAVLNPVDGPVNIAGDGTVSLSRALRRMGLIGLPLPHPLFDTLSGLGARAGLPRLTPDMVRFVRYGRGVDTTRMHTDLRFEPRYTTIAAIDQVADSKARARAA
jgi:UDP-glucose 4-epimerase